MRSRAEIERAIQLLEMAQQGALYLKDLNGATRIAGLLSALYWILDAETDRVLSDQSFADMLKSFETTAKRYGQ